MRVVEGISNIMTYIHLIFILHHISENICLLQERMLIFMKRCVLILCSAFSLQL